MKTASEIDWSLNRILTILVSACIHAGVMVGICCAATEQREKPIVHETKLIEVLQAKKKETPLPKKETPPPKPEPPKPEPPKPEPPKPEPPKPEPPKPEPPKPQPSKPQPPKPVEVKPEQPKINRVEDIRARFSDAKVVPPKPQQQPQPKPYTPPPTPPTLRPSKSADDYERKFKANLSSQQNNFLPPPQSGPSADEDTANYAELYARPIIEENWKPSSFGIKSKNPSVEIAFTVSASGAVSNVRITRRSNEQIMNSSVEDLVRQIQSGQIRFPSLQSAGINRSFLQISITLHLKD